MHSQTRQDPVGRHQLSMKLRLPRMIVTLSGRSVVLRLFELPFHSSFRANVWSGLYLCETAIDEQLGPCDIICIIGGEKHDSSCDIIRGARQCASSATFSNAAANQRFCNWLAPSHATRLDIVEDGVVPVGIEPSDLGIRVETQNVAVRDVYVLALLCNPMHFGRYGPAHLGLDHHYVPLGRDQLDHYDSEVRNCIRKRAPNNIDATTDWHDALAAIRSISS